jgi:regulator of replication initiation timing
MENELNTLEDKLSQLIKVSSTLREENHQLRQDLAHALSANRQSDDKINTAKERLSKILTSLPADAS